MFDLRQFAALAPDWYLRLQYHHELDSTNDEARRLAEAGAEHGTVVLSDHQTAGRGRRGASWICEPGDGLLFSMVIRPSFPKTNWSRIALAAGIGIAETLNAKWGVRAQVKWPNDIYIQDDQEASFSITKLTREHIRSQINQINHDYRDADIEELVMIGYEIQHLAHVLAKPGKTKSSYSALADMAKKIASMTEEMRVKRYQLDYNSAQAIIPALEINLAIAETLELKTIRLPGSDYERGLLLDIPTSFSLTEGFQKEVLRSAVSLARKYRVHRSHSNQVTRLSQLLFEATSELHELDEHYSLLLQCAAIVHECGNFISSRAHHKHSHYIILNSEIFGLGQRDLSIVSLLARYHRRSGPKPNHAGYRDLTAEDRMRVSKLAAILRIADALDHSHTSRVGEIDVSISKQKLNISLKGISDASVERMAMGSKADLFKDIYGLGVAIHEGN